MPDVGLLIQGPLISRGRTGADPQSGGAVVELHTAGDLQRTIEQARRVGFDPIVLCTWDDDVARAEAGRLRELTAVVHVRDPLPCPAYDAQIGKDNRIRQAFGCHEGMRALQAAGRTEYGVRIRTDQTLDLAELRRGTTDSAPGELRTIGIDRRRPTQVLDFVIAGTTNDVVAHYAALVAGDFYSFHDHSHIDIFWKDAFGQFGATSDPGMFITRTSYILDGQLPILRQMYGRRLRPLSAAVAASMTWRGRPFSDDFLRSTTMAEEEWIGGGRENVLRSLPARGIRPTRWTRSHFVDYDRMRRIGLDPGPSSTAPHWAAQGMALWQTRFRTAPRW